MRTAIRANNPVVVFEHKAMHMVKGPVVRGDEHLPRIGRAAVVRSGADVTVVGSLLMVHRALAAADALAVEGIDAEVIDIRWVYPLDMATIRSSFAKTGRLVIAEEQYHEGGWGSTVISSLTVEGAGWAVPPVVVGMPRVPISHSPLIEDRMIPGVERIAEGIRRVMSAR